MKPQILLRSVLLIALIFSLHSAFAQPSARAEGTLCRQLKIIDSFSDAFRGPNHNIDAYDSISRNDSLFGEILQQLTAGNVPLIRTTSGTTGTLGFDYTLDNDRDADFHFNPTTGTITFPVVLEDSHVTKRKITYTFNGKYFVRKNN